MEKQSKSKDELFDKSVVDAKGKHVGKCIDLVEEDEESYLIILVETDDNVKKKSKVPLETIQAVGEMIVLNVEIEGVIEDNEIVTLNNTGNNLDEDGTNQNKESDQTDSKAAETNNDEEKEKNEAKKDNWVLFKSIKS